MIKLIEVKMKDKELFWNINQKYLYEMTNYYNDEMDNKGNYQYGYFDLYFTEKNRKAYFIYSNNTIAGFVMINKCSYLNKNIDYNIAEFTIFQTYRHKHIALKAIEAIFKQYKGSWEIKYNEKNLPAKNLWNKVCEKYNPDKTHLNEYEIVLSFCNK